MIRTAPDFSGIGGRPNIPATDDMVVEAWRTQVNDPGWGRYERLIVTRIIRTVPGSGR